MPDSFLVATRIPMSREGFERWLDAPAPGLGAIANPAAMFDGWFWHGDRRDDWSAPELTPRAFFADRVEQACAGKPATTILLHRDGALEAYLFDEEDWDSDEPFRTATPRDPAHVDPAVLATP